MLYFQLHNKAKETPADLLDSSSRFRRISRRLWFVLGDFHCLNVGTASITLKSLRSPLQSVKIIENAAAISQINQIDQASLAKLENC